MKKLAMILVTLTVGCGVVAALDMVAHADAPPGHFTDGGDGTVRDNMTGLVWQQDFSPTVLTATASATYCTGLTTAGGGWRLPEVMELQTIVDETRSNPAVDPSFFPGTPPASFWSATPWNGPFAGVWWVGFNQGGAGFVDPTTYGRARCVR